MPTRSDAEEHLRIIRSLMEKATIYRAISAEAAAVGGVLAVVASFGFGNWWLTSIFDMGRTIPGIGSIPFLLLWLAVLIVTASVNLFFLWSNARKRGDAFISSGMRMALVALLPSYTVAALLTWLFINGPVPALVVPAWIVCHGLALLATAHFAPRSLVILGWSFLLTGLVSIGPISSAIWPVLAGGPLDPGMPAGREWLQTYSILAGQRWMAGTFGLFHLIYAACTWPRRARGAEAGGTP